MFNSFVFIILVILLLLVFFYTNSGRLESFTANRKSLSIKKTLSYTLIYKCPSGKYSVWEPELIDNYYPLGQVVTLDNNKPNYPSLLVKSHPKGLDKPVKFIVVAKTSDNVGIYRMKCNDNYIAPGHIYSKEIPSVHNFRCLSKYYYQKSSFQSKKVNTDKYSIWSIEGSDYFYTTYKENSKLPTDVPVKLNEVPVESKLDMKYTGKYKKIWSNVNKRMSKSITIWRPIPDKNYVSLGDIALPSDTNPNGNILSETIHQSQVKFPVNYGKHYHSRFDYWKEKKRITVTFWKPKAPPGYVSLGYIANTELSEPSENSIVGCVDLIYTRSEETSSSYHNIWNNLPNDDNKIDIYTDNSNRFIVSKKRKLPRNNNIVLDSESLKKYKDLSDTPRTIDITYTRNDNNKTNYTEHTKTKLVKKAFKDKFNLNDGRVKDVSYDPFNKTVKMKIDSRDHKTNAVKVGSFLHKLNSSLTEEPLKVYTEDNSDYIITLIYMKPEKLDNDKLNLDNSVFNSILEV